MEGFLRYDFGGLLYFQNFTVIYNIQDKLLKTIKKNLLPPPPPSRELFAETLKRK